MDDVHFMKTAIREARKGLGRTSPNPAVGAVIVSHGKVVGKGYHKMAGSPHAEVNAIMSAAAKSKGATLYVTLEPCNHYGRTPPCTKAILDSGIFRVVVGMKDPNPSVAGGGCDYLASRGVEVQTGILEEECLGINRPFIKYIQQRIPWIALKAGLSLDGKIAASTGQSGWITNDKSRRWVHILRNRYDGILVGIDTVIQDNPSLTTRIARGKGKDCVRIILDTHLRIPLDAKVVRQKSNSYTLVYCGKAYDVTSKKNLEKAGVIVQPVKTRKDGYVDLQEVLKDIGRREITSVFVEGGSKVHASFIQQQLADKAYLFFAPIFIGGDGLPVTSGFGLESVREAYRLTGIQTKKFGDDVLIEGFF
jgi:diaminohydroxyphosphoribosylaminopyrimidine deaminase/5-amino-6-(5-phosphoribosylamino)uracil reductase